MAAYFPKFLKAKYGDAFVKKAQDVYYQMSVVKDATIAASAGGVTAMHDATECGVFGGLFEMASHSGVGMTIDKDRIIVQETVRKTCSFFNIDPYISISEGTLLATAKKSRAKAIVNALEDEGIPASIVGEAVPKEEGAHVYEYGKKYRLEHPKVDPFWIRFEEYLKKK
jgi:hydrogenase maturation factor